MLPGMIKKKDAPERMDVRVSEDLKQRLQARADRDNRSRNQQAAHYIELGLLGLGPAEMVEKLGTIERKLDEVLRRLDDLRR